jgi:hypothetical protein
MKNRLARTLTIGVSTTWCGLSTNLLPTGQIAQGGTEEKSPEGQLCHYRLCCHLGGKLSLCHPHGLSGQRGRIIVCTARMYHALLACVAGPNSTGQQIATYLFLNILPVFIFYLVHNAIPREQALLHSTLLWQQFRRPQCGTSRAVLAACLRKESRDTRKPRKQQDNKNKNVTSTFYICHLQGWLLH